MTFGKSFESVKKGFDSQDHTFQSDILEDIVDQAVAFFLDSPVHPLPPKVTFAGPGVYAIYYVGTSGIYQNLGKRNRPEVEIPIYVGQVSSSGVRKGLVDETEDLKKRRLRDRLNKHARSIQQADDKENLNLDDFRCRFMILLGSEAGLSRVVETHLIKRFTPIWNTYVDGFGIHDPGKGRLEQSHSEWDSIHPGRSFLKKMKGSSLATEPITSKIAEVLNKFTEAEAEDAKSEE